MSGHFDGGQFFQGQGLFFGCIDMTQKPRLKLKSQMLYFQCMTIYLHVNLNERARVFISLYMGRWRTKDELSFQHQTQSFWGYTFEKHFGSNKLAKLVGLYMGLIKAVESRP